MIFIYDIYKSVNPTGNWKLFRLVTVRIDGANLKFESIEQISIF
jgi:hypothetical protein